MNEEEKILVLKCDICGEICEDEIDAEQHALDEHWDDFEDEDPTDEELEEWIDEHMTIVFLTKEELRELRDAR